MFRRKKSLSSETPQPTKTEPISDRTDFPSGLAIRTEKGVYFIKGKTRFKFFSERAFASWSLTPVLATFSAIKHFQPGTAYLGFRDGTLIFNVANGRMYLVSGSRKRHIVSPDAFSRFGLNILDAIHVSDEEAAIHQDGEVLK